MAHICDLLRCGRGYGVRARRDEARAGVCGCSLFQWPGYGCRGDLRHPRVRHAGDTPLEGFAWRKSPRWLDSSHVVSPQARCERRADLRNELVWTLQIVPADADDVPALGLKVALALALAGK